MTGGAPSFLLAVGLFVMVDFLLPRLASAHTLGMSTAAFEVKPDGRIDAVFAFAGAESWGGTPLAREDLRAFLLDGVDVTADGKRCDATFRGASVSEIDGLVLSASYACADALSVGPADCNRGAAPWSGLSEIVVTLYYLSALPPGHREIGRIVAGNATSEAVLSGDRRAIALRLPFDALRATRRSRGWRLVMAASTVVVFLSGLFLWRAHPTRKRVKRLNQG
jgi:hypothetical protein